MKVLAIDDDPDFLRLLAVRLATMGHSVFSTESPSTFLKELTDNHYDVALVDFFIPAVKDAGLLLSAVFAPYANGTKIFIMTGAERMIVEQSIKNAVVKIRGILDKNNLLPELEGVFCAA